MLYKRKIGIVRYSNDTYNTKGDRKKNGYTYQHFHDKGEGARADDLGCKHTHGPCVDAQEFFAGRGKVMENF